MKKKHSPHFLNTIALMVVSLIVMIPSYMTIHSVNFKNNNKNLVDNLYILGERQRDSIAEGLEDLKYEIKLYASMDEILSLDRDKIGDRLSFIRAYKNTYTSCLILANNKKLIYGYTDNLEGFLEKSYVKEAFAGQLTISEAFYVGGKYYMDITCPIINKEGKQLGILSFRFLLSKLNDMMKNMRINEDTECYVIDKDGKFITESKYIPDAIANKTVDLKKLKLSIDYSRENEYKNYMGKEVYGCYFPLDIGGWTLVIEKTVNSTKKSNEPIKIAGEISSILEIIAIGVLQTVFKKKFNMDFNYGDISKTLQKYRGGEIKIDELLKKLDNLDCNKCSKKKK